MNISKTNNPIIGGEEKEALEFILSNSFKSGFGTLSKTEIDLRLIVLMH